MQRALPSRRGARLQSVVVGSSLQGLAFVADMVIAGMLHMRLKEVQQHKQSQIADILREMEQLEGVDLVDLVPVGRETQQAADRP